MIALKAWRIRILICPVDGHLSRFCLKAVGLNARPTARMGRDHVEQYSFMAIQRESLNSDLCTQTVSNLCLAWRARQSSAVLERLYSFNV